MCQTKPGARISSATSSLPSWNISMCQRRASASLAAVSGIGYLRSRGVSLCGDAWPKPRMAVKRSYLFVCGGAIEPLRLGVDKSPASPCLAGEIRSCPVPDRTTVAATAGYFGCRYCPRLVSTFIASSRCRPDPHGTPPAVRGRKDRHRRQGVEHGATLAEAHRRAPSGWDFAAWSQ